MAVEETVEICAKLEAEFAMKADAVLMNLVSPLATAPESDIDSLASSSNPAILFAVDRARVERERAAELSRRIPAPQIPIERARRWSSDLDLLDRLGKSLDNLTAVAQ